MQAISQMPSAFQSSVRHTCFLLNICVRYKGCSKSNASSFIMLAHNVRRGCWWYGSRGWTFPPISHYILLPWNRWQQKGSLTKWHLTWKGVWSKGVSLNSSMQRKWVPIDVCWWLLMLAECFWRPDNGCEHSKVVYGAFQYWWWQCEWQATSRWLCRFLQEWHAGFCSLLVKKRS